MRFSSFCSLPMEGSQSDLPVDWNSPGAGTSLEESMLQLGLGSRESYLERPDCSYCMRTGLCGSDQKLKIGVVLSGLWRTQCHFWNFLIAQREAHCMDSRVVLLGSVELTSEFIYPYRNQVCPQAADVVELFIYLGEPCHVCQLLLTISHGADDSTFPGTVDVRTGHNLDGLKLVLEFTLLQDMMSLFGST
ncbi:hypothetical protein HHK36_023276 [Tetracentron sinense]|uniref:SAC9 first GBDL domain-containing protein n=1 Tax=Tetracentron sinense TaxID=13715 RepID=A0A835D5Q3_TETSI|nr:hypothetical protein HHK36_023276 [Tetracentron sinense]